MSLRMNFYVCLSARVRACMPMQTHVGHRLVDVACALAAPLRLRRPVSSQAPLSGEISLTPWSSRSHAASSPDRGCHGRGHAFSGGLRCGPCSRIHGHRVVGQQALVAMQGTMANARGTSSSAAANACSTTRASTATACPRGCRGATAGIAASRGSCAAASPITAPSRNGRSTVRAHGFACATLCRQRAAVEVGQGGSSRALRP